MQWKAWRPYPVGRLLPRAATTRVPAVVVTTNPSRVSAASHPRAQVQSTSHASTRDRPSRVLATVSGIFPHSSSR